MASNYSYSNVSFSTITPEIERLAGKITRNCEIRVVREGIIIADDKLSSLKRFKDDVKEVAEGYECGITLEKFNDIHVGDIFEAYVMEEYRPE